MKQTIQKRHNIPGHALTFSCFNRRTFFKSKIACGYMSDAINYTRIKYNFEVWAYVIMPEHIHLLIYPKNEIYSISKILKSMKLSVAKNIICFLEENYPEKLVHLETGNYGTGYRFWEKGGGYDKNFWSRNEIITQVEYIHNNPVKKGLIENAGDWYWSSAGFWITGNRGSVVVERECFPML